MSFGKTGDADSETAAIRMPAQFVESANELHQIDRVLEGIARLIVAASPRRIAAVSGSAWPVFPKDIPRRRID